MWKSRRFWPTWQRMCKSRRFCPSWLWIKSLSLALSLSLVVSFQCVKSKDYTYPLSVRKNVKYCIWYCKLTEQVDSNFCFWKVYLALGILMSGMWFHTVSSNKSMHIQSSSHVWNHTTKGYHVGLVSFTGTQCKWFFEFVCLYKLLE